MVGFSNFKNINLIFYPVTRFRFYKHFDYMINKKVLLLIFVYIFVSALAALFIEMPSWKRSQMKAKKLNYTPLIQILKKNC